MDIILPSEPVRKIRSGQRGIRGNVPGKGRFESTLEGDLMDLLRFSNSIEDFKPQPIRIPYTLPNGRPSRYTPDGLIFFKRHLQHSPVLYEVKYRDDYKHSWRELRLKFRAARELCRNQGWAFRVFTEFHIYLESGQIVSSLAVSNVISSAAISVRCLRSPRGGSISRSHLILMNGSTCSANKRLTPLSTICRSWSYA